MNECERLLKRESRVTSRWDHRESNCMFTLSSDKGQRNKFAQCKLTLMWFSMFPLGVHRKNFLFPHFRFAVYRSPSSHPTKCSSNCSIFNYVYKLNEYSALIGFIEKFTNVLMFINVSRG